MIVRVVFIYLTKKIWYNAPVNVTYYIYINTLFNLFLFVKFATIEKCAKNKVVNLQNCEI